MQSTGQTSTQAVSLVPMQGSQMMYANDLRQYIRMLLTWLLAALLTLPDGFTESPAYVRLFTPAAVPPGTYRTFTTSRDLDAVLAGLPRDASRPEGSGSFEPQLEIAADAFGQSGGYNRWKLALLYGARRARVARGPRLEDGRVVEAWTLVSPYPDPQLDRLNRGTLLIVLRLQP